MKAVLVCGGRDFTDRDMVERELDRLHRQHGFVILGHGGSNGVDAIAHDWALRHGVPIQTNWLGFDMVDEAGARDRYTDMLENLEPALVIAFPGGEGTRRIVAFAKANQLAVLEIDPVAA